MDNGNHFYKCDLQIHSPRDRGWIGPVPSSEEERMVYAKGFIQDCRKAGLHAIAISDHHDLIYFEYIKRASIEEKDIEGNLISQDKRIVVFPAVELTLHSPPIQGILIFDTSLPENLFPTVLGALSIAQAPKTDEKTIETIPISQATIASINDLYIKLDAIDAIKGRYIFLPHIKEKGHKTLIREGFHEAYSKMPCVGGYVDSKYEGGGLGYLNILNGKVDAYGYKSIAIIQTSDFRGAPKIYENNISTWIKWAIPTAEAIRQACLAKESRISLVNPEVPNIYIEKVDVTNSAFMGKFALDLNQQLNSIIGGRGTGKSTVLEYIRWALCDETEDFGKDEEKSEILRKRITLIEKTLKDHDGEVRIFFMVNGLRHIIKRNTKSEDVLLKIGEGEFQSVRPNQIKELLPVQSYSQKQLSSVAVKTDELKRFIQRPISKIIEEYNSELLQLSSKMRSAYLNLLKSKSARTQLEKYAIELGSYRLQIDQLRKDLKGMSEEDMKIIDRASLYTNERNRIEEIKIEYHSIRDSLLSTRQLITRFISSKTEARNIENKSIISELETERTDFLQSLTKKIQALIIERDDSEKKFEKIKAEWIEMRNGFEKLYKEAKEKTTSSQQTLNSIKELELKIERLDLMIRQTKSELAITNANDDDFDLIYLKFIECQIAKTEKIKEATVLFSDLSSGLIKADFTNFIDSTQLSNQINTVFSANGLGIQRSRADDLCASIAIQSNPIEKWKQVVYELKLLLEFNVSSESIQELPHTPILDASGFTPGNKRKCSESLTSESFLNIASIQLEYLPKFNYVTSNAMGDQIPFEDASAGQQATALLNVLLNQDGYPLIIDQPEDDIDNKAIDSIIKNLWSAKQKRQIIISSHNANLVVNGDSELVVCCDYNETSEQTKGLIKYQGSIDSLDIRNEITSVMEGGERAFKLRKEKYGF